MGVDVLFKFTLSPDAADNPDGNLDRFFGPANSILIEPDGSKFLNPGQLKKFYSCVNKTEFKDAHHFCVR